MKEFVYEDYVIKVGENAMDNWNLIDSAKNNDNNIWFHLDKYPSGHVICFVKKEDIIDKNIILFCATLCKEQSKQKHMKNVKVIYTEIKNVKKKGDVGEVETKKCKYVKV